MDTYIYIALKSSHPHPHNAKTKYVVKRRKIYISIKNYIKFKGNEIFKKKFKNYIWGFRFNESNTLLNAQKEIFLLLTINHIIHLHNIAHKLLNQITFFLLVLL